LAEFFDGTTDVVNHVASPGRLLADGVDARIDLTELELNQESTGVPCARVLAADGAMDVDDRANGIRFSQTLSSVTIRFREEPPDTLVEINGDIANGCLGNLTLGTVEPLRLRNAVDCPTGGTLRVTAAGRTSEIRYGPQGELSIDYNGDGRVDSIETTCELAAQCIR
jgi:hypothetical protein